MGLSQKAKQAKGQSSFEYMLVVGLTLVLILPTIYLLYTYSLESSKSIESSQLTKIGTDIIDSAESIFYSGKGSKTVLELNIPDSILNAVIIDNRELVFNVSTETGITEILFISAVKLTTVNEKCFENVCKLDQFNSPGFKELKLTVTEENLVMIE